jgi:hypothetical protein
LKRSLKLEIGRSHVEQLLHPRASVQECEKEGVVATAIARATVSGFEHCTEFLTFEVVDGTDTGAFEWDGKQTLAPLHVLRGVGGDVTSERVDCGKTGIAGGGAIFAALFKMIEKRDNAFRIEIIEVELVHLPPTVFCKEA